MAGSAQFRYLSQGLAGQPRRGLLGLLAALLLAVPGVMTVQADDAAVKPSASKALLERLRRARPDIPVQGVAATPLDDVFAVELEGGVTLYGTADGQYLFAGDMYRIEDNALVNLAESRRQERRVELISSVPAEDAWVFAPAKGDTKAVINVFTDIDCGYCRKLHQEVPRLNELGVEVRYLAYPRSGIGTPSYNTIVSAWCADNRLSAMTDAKAGKSITTKTCVNPVADQFQLGQQVGVTGTPAIVTDTGRLLPGYMPADRLAETLGITPAG